MLYSLNLTTFYILLAFKLINFKMKIILLNNKSRYINNNKIYYRGINVKYNTITVNIYRAVIVKIIG